MSPDEAPLPGDSSSDTALATPDEPVAAPRPTTAPRSSFKISTFILVFLGLLGFLMLIDTGTRSAITNWMGNANNPGWLYTAIGFNSNYLLLTMAIAGAIEMAATAIAYNYTTDWIKAAKVQKWSSAFRKVQMAAFRSGKKDRIDELKPFQQRLTRMSGEVSIAQFKGMAITWFLLIVIYSWVGGVIGAAPSAYVTLAGTTQVNLTGLIFGYFPLWFFMFSLYTIPLSFIFRRFLKDYWLHRYERKHLQPPTGTA